MIKKLSIPLIYILCLSLCLQGCKTSRFNTKEDYEISTRNFSNGYVTKTLNELPVNEKNTFIDIMEKTYLNLLLGYPKIEPLIKYSRKIDKKVQFKISDELRAFFYLETPEGYYASEHEIILMYLFLSWGYSLRKNYEKARIEVKKAAYLLENEWSEKGAFDDSFLRIISAIMWTMCGEWEEARVDLRAAIKLNPSLKWVKELSNLEIPPKNILMVLGGTGPEITWNPDIKSNVIRGIRNLKFVNKGNKSNILLKDRKNNSIDVHLTSDSSYWYKRHLKRNNIINKLINDSKYGGKLMTSTLKAAGKITVISVIGISIIAVSLALGAGIIYAAFQGDGSADTGEIALMGLFIGILGTGYGASFTKEKVEDTIETAKHELDISDKYRFVRFLPEYAWIGWTDKDLTYPIFVNNSISKKVTPIIRKNPKEGSIVNNISIGFFPDIIYRSNKASNVIVYNFEDGRLVKVE